MITMMVQYKKVTRVISYLRNRTTLRLDILHSFKVCAFEISGFSTAHAYKYKTKWQAKMKQRQASHQTESSLASAYLLKESIF